MPGAPVGHGPTVRVLCSNSSPWSWGGGRGYRPGATVNPAAVGFPRRPLARMPGLAVVLGLVGLLVACVGYPRPDLATLVPAPQAQSITLRVFTYNVGLLSVLGQDLVPDVSHRQKALPGVLDAWLTTQEPNLVVLQEVWSQRSRRLVEEVFKAHGYTVWRGGQDPIFGLGSGLILAVDSQWVVESKGFEPHYTVDGIAGLAKRGNAWAVLRGVQGGERLVVVGTHLMAADTDQGIPLFPKQVLAMEAQVAQIVSLVDHASLDGSIPVVVVGDFNAGPGYVDGVWQRAIAGLIDSAAEAEPGTLFTWDQGNPRVSKGNYPQEPSARIDHILLRPQVGGAVRTLHQELVHLEDDKGPLSDHHGLLMEVVISGPGP